MTTLELQDFLEKAQILTSEITLTIHAKYNSTAPADHKQRTTTFLGLPVIATGRGDQTYQLNSPLNLKNGDIARRAFDELSRCLGALVGTMLDKGNVDWDQKISTRTGTITAPKNDIYYILKHIRSRIDSYANSLRWPADQLDSFLKKLLNLRNQLAHQAYLRNLDPAESRLESVNGNQALSGIHRSFMQLQSVAQSHRSLQGFSKAQAISLLQALTNEVQQGPEENDELQDNALAFVQYNIAPFWNRDANGEKKQEPQIAVPSPPPVVLSTPPPSPPLQDGWECERCTFRNSHLLHTCEMCRSYQYL
jgi:hypothetical protein